jgi:hypothetical protein
MQIERYREPMALEWTSVGQTGRTMRDWTPGPQFYVPQPGVFSNELAGFAHANRSMLVLNGTEHKYALWAIPLWALIVLFAMFPTARFIIVLKRRARREEGYCPECGYDMRATPHRCPECGWELANQFGY